MFLDIAIGIILAFLTGQIFHFPVNALWLLLGIGFALLPDIDVIYELVKRSGNLGGKELGGHREWTHYPLLYIPFVFVIFYVFGPPLAFLAASALFWHVLHDSMGLGWGIVALGPFSDRRYKFFSRKDGSFSWQSPIVSWEREELRALVRERGNENWIRDTYLRPTWTSVTEILALAIALALLLRFL